MPPPGPGGSQFGPGGSQFGPGRSPSGPAQAPPPHSGPQAPSGPQFQAGPDGASGVALTTKFFPLAWLLFFFKPKLTINGQPGPQLSWGQNFLNLPPGQYHLRVWTPYFLPPQMGPGEVTTDVAPGQVVPLEYRAPLWAFSRGSLGVGPQSYNGLGITIALMVVPFVILIALLIMIVALG